MAVREHRAPAGNRQHRDPGELLEPARLRGDGLVRADLGCREPHSRPADRRLDAGADRHDLAVEWISRAIKQELKPEYLTSLGNTLLKQGRGEEALKTFDKAVQLRPDSAELWKNLGDALAKLERPDEALLTYQHALKLDPHNSEAADKSASLLSGLSEQK